VRGGEDGQQSGHPRVQPSPCSKDWCLFEERLSNQIPRAPTCCSQWTWSGVVIPLSLIVTMSAGIKGKAFGHRVSPRRSTGLC